MHDQNCNPPMLAAVLANSTEIAALLLQHGAPVRTYRPLIKNKIINNFDNKISTIPVNYRLTD
jgi:hypothetical protein